MLSVCFVSERFRVLQAHELPCPLSLSRNVNVKRNAQVVPVEIVSGGTG